MPSHYRLRKPSLWLTLVVIMILAVFNSACSTVPESVDSPGAVNSTPASSCSTIPEPVDSPVSSCSTIPEIIDYSGSTNSTGSGITPVCLYRIVNTYPHDPGAFTQGLFFENGFLYEGTGLHERSTLRRVDLETGDVVQLYELPEKYFGEGITVYEDRIIQLTWQSREGFVYDKESFELLRKFDYPTEGWGITHDGKQLIMSDGTANLYFLDPETFVETGRIQVSDSNGPVTRLNELEYVKGEIYANIWQTDRIARISPDTGEVLDWIDLEGLLKPEDKEKAVDVLNGIAYDAVGDRLFVTGKLWPKLFEIIPVDTSNWSCLCAYR
jgi:glutamine cyclotransferase